MLRSGTLLQWDRGTHGLTAVVVACIRPIQDQASQHSSMEWEGLMRPPPLAEELLRVDGCWGRESQFSLRVYPPVGQPSSSGWLQTQGYTSSTYWTQWIIEKKEEG